MSSKRKIFGKAAALTVMISAATAMFWAAMEYFNRRSENKEYHQKNDKEK